MSTETQPVGTQHGDISAPEQFLPGAAPAAQVPSTPDPTPVVAATEAPPVEAPAATPAIATDPYEAAINASMEAEKPVEFTPEFKAAFKALTGQEDPVAYKSDVETRLTQAELLKAEYDQILPLKQQLEAMPPALKRAYQLAMEGKAQEAQDFLRGLPDGVFLNKEAKDLPSEKLLEAYLPGKMSKDDLAALKDPDTDPDILAALKAKEKHYRDIATDMHERERARIEGETKQHQELQKAALDRYNQGVAEAIATAKADPLLKPFVDQSTIESVQTGQFLRSFLQDDGVTPTKEAATLLLKALHFDKMAKAQYSVGFSKGKSVGMLEATSGQPGAPPTSGRITGGDPPPSTEQSAADKILSRLGMKVA